MAHPESQRDLLSRLSVADIERVLPLHDQTKQALRFADTISGGDVDISHLILGIVSTEQGANTLHAVGFGIPELITLMSRHIYTSDPKIGSTGGKTSDVVDALVYAEEERKRREAECIIPSDLILGILRREEFGPSDMVFRAASGKIERMSIFRAETIGRIHEVVPTLQF